MLKKRILIADDQMATREALTLLATKRGYDVVAVTNGLDLLKKSQNEKFDVLITDLIMPDLDGAAATEILKMGGSTMPVIAVTGLDEHDTRLVGSKFARIYHKPIKIGEMLEYIDSLLAN